MDQYYVIGDPVAHSLSPQIYTKFAEQTGQPLKYDKLQVSLDQLPSVLKKMIGEGVKGCSVTLPLKAQAFQLADDCSQRVTQAQAANCLKFDNGKILAENFDGIGLVCDLRNRGIGLSGKRILMLGAGGAARGVLGPILSEQPAQVVIANRTRAKAKQLADAFKVIGIGLDDIEGQFDLVINATSASIQGDIPNIDPAILQHCIAYDMMYGQPQTAFQQFAQAQGAVQAIDGLGMLVEQAALSFEWWRDVLPDTQPIYQWLSKGLEL